MQPMPQKVIVAENILAREVAAETVLLDLQNGRYFSLNEVGTRTWQLFNEFEGATSPILEQLYAEYDVSKITLQNDFLNLVGQLQEAGLITAK